MAQASLQARVWSSADHGGIPLGRISAERRNWRSATPSAGGSRGRRVAKLIDRLRDVFRRGPHEPESGEHLVGRFFRPRRSPNDQCFSCLASRLYQLDPLGLAGWRQALPSASSPGFVIGWNRITSSGRGRSGSTIVGVTMTISSDSFF